MNVLLVLIIGFFSGITNALFGVGGGVVMVPAMVVHPQKVQKVVRAARVTNAKWLTKVVRCRSSAVYQNAVSKIRIV